MQAAADSMRLAVSYLPRVDELGPNSHAGAPTPPTLSYENRQGAACVMCGTSNTPTWRQGPEGVRNLCNACGLRWKRKQSQPPCTSCGKAMVRRIRPGASAAEEPAGLADFTCPSCDSAAGPDTEGASAVHQRRMTEDDASLEDSADQLSGSGNTVGLACRLCGATETTIWRRGPSGSRELCNPCGIRWARQQKASAPRPTQSQPLSSAGSPLPQNQTFADQQRLSPNFGALSQRPLTTASPAASQPAFQWLQQLSADQAQPRSSCNNCGRVDHFFPGEPCAGCGLNPRLTRAEPFAVPSGRQPLTPHPPPPPAQADEPAPRYAPPRSAAPAGGHVVQQQPQSPPKSATQAPGYPVALGNLLASALPPSLQAVQDAKQAPPPPPLRQNNPSEHPDGSRPGQPLLQSGANHVGSLRGPSASQPVPLHQSALFPAQRGFGALNTLAAAAPSPSQSLQLPMEQQPAPAPATQPKRGRPPSSAHVKACLECGTSNSPCWRNGPDGPNSLCNACGIRWQRANKAPGDGTNESHKKAESKAPRPNKRDLEIVDDYSEEDDGEDDYQSSKNKQSAQHPPVRGVLSSAAARKASRQASKEVMRGAQPVADDEASGPLMARTSSPDIELLHKQRGQGGVWQRVQPNDALRVTKGKGKSLRLLVKPSAPWRNQIVGDPALSILDLSGPEPTYVGKEGLAMVTARQPFELEFSLMKCPCRRMQIVGIWQMPDGTEKCLRTIAFSTHDNGKSGMPSAPKRRSLGAAASSSGSSSGSNTPEPRKKRAVVKSPPWKAAAKQEKGSMEPQTEEQELLKTLAQSLRERLPLNAPSQAIAIHEEETEDEDEGDRSLHQLQRAAESEEAEDEGGVAAAEEDGDGDYAGPAAPAHVAGALQEAAEEQVSPAQA